MDNNSIDFARIYGLTGCPEGGCVPTGNIIPNVPSLEQIAAYNQALARLRQTVPDESTMRLENALREAELDVGYPITQPTTSNRQIAGAMSPTTPPETGIQRNGGTTAASSSGEYSMIREYNQPFPVTGESIQYLNGFMRTQIGRRVEIQILVGTNTLITKEGFLLGVGANYILINETDTNDLTTCDFYNIKFVRYFYN